ncbi:unnamed protein product [Rotaria sordida]|uniref:Uncharacterized protein n=1 Tax=Rotaria sordida TaxID=392033 RepID=A0A816DUM8_9BILA|nr:unnamed protein product [Rotaria sordida]CAF1639299.1 unnamed protein product [Rotaria sordida]
MTSYLDVATSKMGNERSDNNVFRESTDSTSVDASIIYNCTINCSVETQINEKLLTASNELYIPARTLYYEIYQLKLTVTIVRLSRLDNSSYAYVKIIRSNITATLVKLGTSLITYGACIIRIPS